MDNEFNELTRLDAKDFLYEIDLIKRYNSPGGYSSLDNFIKSYNQQNQKYLDIVLDYINKRNTNANLRLFGIDEFDIEEILNETLLDKKEAEKFLHKIKEIYNGPGGLTNLQKLEKNFSLNSFKEYKYQIYLKKVIEYFHEENQGGKPRFFGLSDLDIKERILGETFKRYYC